MIEIPHKRSNDRINFVATTANRGQTSKVGTGQVGNDVTIGSSHLDGEVQGCQGVERVRMEPQCRPSWRSTRRQ